MATLPKWVTVGTDVMVISPGGWHVSTYQPATIVGVTPSGRVKVKINDRVDVTFRMEAAYRDGAAFFEYGKTNSVYRRRMVQLGADEIKNIDTQRAQQELRRAAEQAVKALTYGLTAERADEAIAALTAWKAAQTAGE